MQSFLERSGWLLYGALNLAVLLALVVGAVVGGGSLSELPYVMLMFAICSSSIPFIHRLNGPFAMLTVIGAVYFLGFVMSDALGMFTAPKAPRPGDAIFDAGEVILIVGVLVQVIGFHIGVRITRTSSDARLVKDWPAALLLPSGLLLWGLGAAATLYQSLVVQSDNTSAAVTSGFAKLGLWNTSGLILVENYAGPLGIVILAYWWTKFARRGGGTLMLAIVFAQFAVGWIVDQKETSLNAPVMMLMTRFVVDGRVPMRWLVCSVLGIVLVFPVLTAKRVIMTEGLGLTRAQALAHTGEILMRAIAERQSARDSNKYEEKTQTFLERATDKGAVEVFAQHSGIDHPYRMGSTFEPVLYTFIPRVFWSEKPGDNSAVTFNREFHLSADPDTHMSPTHIGELYWNFGLPGVVVGMTMIGMFLGFICARFDPSAQSSMTGTLILIVTFYELVARRGGQIEIEYVVWMRTLLLIGLMHLCFAKAPARPTRQPVKSRSPVPGASDGQPTRFPNLIP